MSMFRSKWLWLPLLFVTFGCFHSHQTIDAAEIKGDSQLYLVSVGTGDPDNITIRAQTVIRDSQIIFCDQGIREKFAGMLQNKEIHDSGTGIHWIYGKSLEESRNQFDEVKKSRHFVYDEKMKEVDGISSIIRKAINEGRTVSVLENGDPAIYGQNMWYMEAFADLKPEIVPGISSFNAANAVLKREVSAGKQRHSVILTAPYVNSELTGSDDIESLAALHASMVLFTMRVDFQDVVAKLRKHYPSETPIAIVLHAGYRQKERIVQGTLSSINDELKKEGTLPFENLIYVGDFLTNRPY